MSLATRKTSVLAVLLLCGACRSDYDIGSGPVSVNPGDLTDCEFTPIPGSKMSRYDCNPIFSGSSNGEDWLQVTGGIGYRAELVMGHAFYQMWYVGYPDAQNGGNWGVGYAVSSNGVDWVPAEENPLYQEPANGGWDKSAMQGPTVVYDPVEKEYHLMYHGINFDSGSSRLGLMGSKDGIDWAMNANNPILDLTQAYQGNRYCWPLTFTWTGDGFRGYLTGGADTGFGNDVCEMYDYGGPSVNDMTLGRNPILRAGPQWYDQSGFTSASVVQFEGTYYMFYSGFETWTDDPGGQWRYATNASLSLATSEDGVTWTKHPDNPIPVEASITGEIGDVSAQVVGERIHLWISDYYEEEDGTAVGYFYYEPNLAEPHPE